MTDSECLIGILTRLAQEPYVREKDKKDPMSLDVYLEDESGDELFSANITHNLNEMADAGGFYKPLWRPDEMGVTMRGRDMIPHLKRAVSELSGKPDFYKKYDSPNGWGTWSDFLPWLCLYLEACKRYPDALVKACG